MRKTMLLAAMLSLTVLMFAAYPAMALDRDDRSVSQEVEQEADSGDVDQSFEVSGGGDNSNQTASIQGVANTGNAQNVIDVVDTTGDFGDFDGDNDFFDLFDGDDGDFEFDELESSIEVNPTSTTTCDNEVNQAASASG